MPLSKESSFTTDYIFSLPEGQRAELIDGVGTTKPASSGTRFRTSL